MEISDAPPRDPACAPARVMAEQEPRRRFSASVHSAMSCFRFRGVFLHLHAVTFPVKRGRKCCFWPIWGTSGVASKKKQEMPHQENVGKRRFRGHGHKSGHLRICENLPRIGELMFFDPRNPPQIGKIAKLGWKPSSDGGNRDTAIGSQRHFGDDEPHINRESSNKETDCRRSLRPEARVQKPEPHQMANAANSWEKQKGMTEAMPWNETLPSFVSRASARRPSGPARNQARPAYRGRKSKRGQ